MSNAPSNKEQNELIELTVTQESPYLAKPTDFVVGDGGSGRRFDYSEAERAALLEEADDYTMSPMNRPIPDRHHVPLTPATPYRDIMTQRNADKTRNG
jgi:hypothetical protein